MVNRPQTISKLELAGTEATMYSGIVVQYLQVFKKNSLSQFLQSSMEMQTSRSPEEGKRAKAGTWRSCLGPVIAIFHIFCSIRTNNRPATLPDTSICMHFSPVFFIFSRHRYRETHTIPAGYCHWNIQYLENQQGNHIGVPLRDSMRYIRQRKRKR